MSKALLFVCLPMMTLLLWGAHSLEPEQRVRAESATALYMPSDTFDMEAALETLREEIRGRENEPSEMVFSNIGIMLGIPAGRMLRIMEFGFSKSLGVDCTHCHNPEDWASDDIPAKEVSRKMWEMTTTINKGLLLEIENLQSEEPTVNCTTCHRGEIKPALRME